MRYVLIVFCFIQFCSGKILAQVQPGHTVIVILENHSYNELVGNAAAPYINSIFNDLYTAVLTKSFALTHPSQPNYLMLFSGSAQGVVNDNVPSGLPFTAPNLGASLLQNGFTFNGYSETMPSVGYTNATSGKYARKHNPWVNWQGTGTNGIPPASNLPFTYFPANFDSLPSLSFVIPNLNNDMHDGTIAAGDAWIKANLDKYIQWCKINNSLFMLIFDEDDKSQSNQIVTAITGENVKGGSYSQQITHYNVLRTIEELYKLPYAGASADSSAIKNIWLSIELCPGGSAVITSDITATNYQWQVNTGSGFANIADDANYAGINASKLQLSNIPSSWYGYQYRAVADGTNSNPVALQFTDYWKGTVSNAWEDYRNWDCGAIPDSNTAVIINSGNVLVSSNLSVRSLKVKPNVVFTVSPGNTFTVNH